MTWIELEVRTTYQYQNDWEWCGIDERLIPIVRRAKGNDQISLIYDQDGVLIWEVNMPYDDLIEKLNRVSQHVVGRERDDDQTNKAQ